MLLIKCGAQAGSVSLKMHSKGGLDTFLKLFCDCRSHWTSSIISTTELQAEAHSPLDWTGDGFIL